VTLSPVSTQQGALLIIKDKAGNAFSNKIVLSTTGLDSLNTTALSTNYGTWFLINDGIKSWFFLDSYANTVSTSATVLPSVPPLSIIVSFLATNLFAYWTAVINTVSYSVSYYSNTAASNTGGTLIQTVTGLTSLSNSIVLTPSPTNYYYATVTAINANGTTVTASSPTIQAIIIPLIPTSVNLSSNSSALIVSFSSALFATSYTINFFSGDNVLIQTIVTPLTTVTSTNLLVTGIRYYATVQATNANGVSPTAVSNSILANVVPLSPTNVNLVLNGLQLLCTWNATANASSYTVRFYQNTTASTTGGTLFETDITAARQQLSVNALIDVKYYYATVQATNFYGSSLEAFSNSILTNLVPPSPTNVNIILNGSILLCTWNAAANASSYTVRFYQNTTASTSGGTLFETDTSTGVQQQSVNALGNALYFYATVSAVNSYGSSVATVTAASTQQLFLPLQGGSIIISYITVTLSSVTITPATNSTNYAVYICTSQNISTSVYSFTTTSLNISFTASPPLVYGTTYYAIVIQSNSLYSSSPQVSPAYTFSSGLVAPTSGIISLVNYAITTSSVTGASSYSYYLYSNATNTTTGALLVSSVSSSNLFVPLNSLTTIVTDTYYYALIAASNAIGLGNLYQTPITFLPSGYVPNTGITAITVNAYAVQGTGANLATVTYNGPNDLWNAGWIATTMPGTGSSFYCMAQAYSPNQLQMHGFISALPTTGGGDQYPSMVRSWFIRPNNEGASFFENGIQFGLANASVITSNSVFKVVYDATTSNTYYYSDNYLQRTVNGVITQKPGGVQRQPGSVTSNIIFGFTNNPSAVGSNTCPT